MSRNGMVLKVLLDVNSLEVVGKRSLTEIEAILNNTGYPKEILWRAPDGQWWVHIQRAVGVEQYYDVMVRNSHDDILLFLIFKSLKEVERQTPFHLCDFRVADVWTNKREWVL